MTQSEEKIRRTGIRCTVTKIIPTTSIGKATFTLTSSHAYCGISISSMFICDLFLHVVKMRVFIEVNLTEFVLEKMFVKKEKRKKTKKERKRTKIGTVVQYRSSHCLILYQTVPHR